MKRSKENKNGRGFALKVLIAAVILCFIACNNGTVTLVPPEDPIADDFDIIGLEHIWDGSHKEVTITPKEGKSTGQITVFYDGITDLPSAIGLYPVTFNVAETQGFNSAVGLSAGILEILPTGTASTPEADPEAGEYAVTQYVDLFTATSGAKIHYTTDGNIPSALSPIFEDPIVVDVSMTIKAIAMKDGMTDSGILEAVYIINPDDPGDPGDPDDPDDPEGL